METTEEFDYKKYLQLVGKKKYLFITLALIIMAGVTITSYFLPERYEAKSTVFIEKSFISELVKGIAASPSSDDNISVLAYTLRSRPLLVKVANDLDLGVNGHSSGQLDKTINDFQKNTDIRLNDKDGFFSITYSNEDPRLARDFVNTLVRRYVEANITSKREESYGATNFLGEQITTIKAKLDEAESRANSYKRENGNVIAQSEALLLGEIGEAQQKINEISVRRHQLESMLSLAKKNNPLKVKLAGLQKKQQDLSLVYTENHPDIVATKNEISAVKEQMQSGAGDVELAAVPSLEVEKISMELNSLRDMENNQRRFIASKQALFRSIPAARTELDELEREKNSQKVIYEQLMAKNGQVEVSKQMEVQDKSTVFRIVEPALLPLKPYSPNRVKIILLGIAGGLLASFGFLVLLDHLDKSVRNVESLKALGVQILAVVPTIEIPTESAALRKRDNIFYGIAAACFLLILATIPLELMRYLSFDIFNASELKSHLMKLSLK